MGGGRKENKRLSGAWSGERTERRLRLRLRLSALRTSPSPRLAINSSPKPILVPSARHVLPPSIPLALDAPQQFHLTATVLHRRTRLRQSFQCTPLLPQFALDAFVGHDAHTSPARRDRSQVVFPSPAACTGDPSRPDHHHLITQPSGVRQQLSWRTRVSAGPRTFVWADSSNTQTVTEVAATAGRCPLQPYARRAHTSKQRVLRRGSRFLAQHAHESPVAPHLHPSRYGTEGHVPASMTPTGLP
ncbi:hypothetical protein BD413DRAFT_78975 [Trametes elegans]|nr:hypothetical protein BD413DRAFT_78975 [Trametes elegans]